MNEKSVLEELAESADPKVAARFHTQAKEGLVNPIVLASLLNVRPQMIYGYIRKGRFTQEGASSINNTQKITLRLDEASQFALSYISRKEALEEKKKAKIQAELRGEVYTPTKK